MKQLPSATVEAVWGIISRTNMIVLVATAFLVGCLDFGLDVELVAPNVTAKELTQVSQRTGIQFPEGTTGLAYMFLGSGIDDALAIKVSIPEEKKADFLKNDLFQGELEAEASVQIGKGQPWWTPDKLADRKNYSRQLPQGRYVECSFGKEGGKWIAYISWMST